MYDFMDPRHMTTQLPIGEMGVLAPAGAWGSATLPLVELHNQPDHFVNRDGKIFAGTHLVVDFWGASNLADLEQMETAMVSAVANAGAILLHIHLHHFTPSGDISGVAVLAESHLSVHTWPERNFAAFDMFMCGEADPHKAIPVLRAAFNPQLVNVGQLYRGVVEKNEQDPFCTRLY